MLSPAVYLRCSENSTEKPWNGLACRPEMNPSTMNLARRSSRETWRITSGFRYFSAVLAKGQPRATIAMDGCDVRHQERGTIDEHFPQLRSTPLRRGLAATATVVFRYLGLADLGDQPADQALGGLPFGLCLEVGANPVPEHGDGDLADIVERDAETTVHGRHRLTPKDQVLAGTRP